MQFLHPRHAFPAIGRLTNEFKIRRTVDELPDGRAYQRMIIGNDDAGGFHLPAAEGAASKAFPRVAGMALVQRADLARVDAIRSL